uniref:Alpha/beta hydrolase fold-3 domain-containing protein n=1 Tax=Zosterops lateralis melanops TaxID=1220523 RepID=A0A8D2QN18_ZOSLA
MASVYKTLATIGILFISPILMPALFLGVVLYDFFNSETPPGIEQPLKLRFFHSLLITTMVAVMLYGIPPCRDSKLLTKDLTVDEVPLRIYQPKSPPTGKRRGILYFHGGAGTFGSISAYERICRYMAKKCNSVVVSVGYRLAPEHPYPGQYLDCLNATLYFMRHLEEYYVDPGLIIISGDSCGGNFAAAICQILLNDRNLPKVRAQILIYPGLQGLDFQLPSYQQNGFVPILTWKMIIYLCFRYLNRETKVWKDVLQNCHVPESMRHQYKKWISADLIPDEFKIRGYVPPKPAPYKPEAYEAVKEILALPFSPLLAEDSIICQLPECYIVTCEFDVLRDDGLLYKKRLEDNGVQVTWYHCKNAFHGILAVFGYGIFSFSSGDMIVDSVVNYINSL